MPLFNLLSLSGAGWSRDAMAWRDCSAGDKKEIISTRFHNHTNEKCQYKTQRPVPTHSQRGHSHLSLSTQKTTQNVRKPFKGKLQLELIRPKW